MFCPKCGKELADSARFCAYCGSKLKEGAEEEQRSSPMDRRPEKNSAGPQTEMSAVSFPQRRKCAGDNTRRLIPVIAAAAILLITGVMGFRMYSGPAAQMNRAIKAGDLELACDIFNANFYAEDLSDKSIELLKTAAVQAQEDYLSGSITYDNLCETLNFIRRFDSEQVAGTLTEVLSTIETKHQIEILLSDAETYLKDSEYLMAIDTYEQVLLLDSANQAAADGREKAEDTYRDTVMEQAENFADEGDFESAEKTLTTAQTVYFGSDGELLKALDSLAERETEQMTGNVRAAAEEGDWDRALELLDDYQERYPDSQHLKDVRTEIEEKIPITLERLQLISSDEVRVIDSSVGDRWGNTYEGAVYYDASNDAYGLYNLNKAYTSFKGTVFVPGEASNGKNMSVLIYLDETLARQIDNITEESAPVTFEVDVAGASTMRIVTDNTGSYPYGWLYFADTSFQRTGT